MNPLDAVELAAELVATVAERIDPKQRAWFENQLGRKLLKQAMDRKPSGTFALDVVERVHRAKDDHR